MKKILFIIVLFCVYISFPIKPMAVYLVDDNGKPIEKNLKEDEVTILMAPDATVSSDEIPINDHSRYIDSDASVWHDGNDITGTESNDNRINENENQTLTTGYNDEIFKTISIEEDNLAITSNEKDSNGLILLTSGVGILLGTVGGYFLVFRKK